MAIETRDEELHPIGSEQHWQESWYFNWADPSGNAFGLARIGFRFNQGQMDGLVLTLRDGRPEFVYPAVNLQAPWGGWQTQTAAGGIRTRGLVFRCEKPLERWRITLEGSSAMELSWTTEATPFDYHDSGRELPPDVAGEHFEQPGRVRGWTRFKGQEATVDGHGERDKSWGVRDWANVEGWNWISAQFGDGLAFNCWEGFAAGRRYINGYVQVDGENHAIEALSIEFRWLGGREHELAGATIELDCEGGRHFSVVSTTLARCPLVKSGLYLEEVHSSFALDAPGLHRSGVGVIEHAWHAGTRGTLRRVPRLLRAAGQLLLP